MIAEKGADMILADTKGVAARAALVG
jgi:hypothetical protein